MKKSLYRRVCSEASFRNCNVEHGQESCRNDECSDDDYYLRSLLPCEAFICRGGRGWESSTDHTASGSSTIKPIYNICTRVVTRDSIYFPKEGVLSERAYAAVVVTCPMPVFAQEEKRALDARKVLHIRELKRVAHEDRSKFANRPTLSGRCDEDD